tara:strand:+ start:2417 stop:2680 length:264 start_codon:yes stop_codon:yes gene_type:complete
MAAGESVLKGNCPSCDRKIQKTITDTCMYCGASLEAEQRFTPEEKKEILRSKQKLAKDLNAKTSAAPNSTTGSTFLAGGDLGGGGDC